MSIVPSVLLNPEDSQWEEMLKEVLMKNKCYYIIINVHQGNVKYFQLYFSIDDQYAIKIHEKSEIASPRLPSAIKQFGM